MRGAVAETQQEGDANFRIPGHENLRELARGGMGIVYQARQIAPQREVAIKMLLPRTITEELRERFRLEARTMADLNHPGILPLHHFGEWAGVPFFTMKLASGGTLSARSATYAGQWRKTATLIADLADAVAHAHDHGVLHRDLKPGNILFDENDRAYVADFGLVKIANSESQFTRSVAMMGTPQYLAPEVAAKDARAATVRSDLYSLGAVLYELLAQQPPFQAEGLPALLREIAETEPAPLRKLGVPRDLATIAHTCLAKDPLRRYDSAAALAADLRAWLAGETISARPVSGLEKVWRYAQKHPALTLLSCLLVTAVVTGMILQHQANLALRQTSQRALAEQVHAVRQGGQWDLRDGGLKAASEAALLGNNFALRNDAITLLATPGCEELDRRPYHQTTWTPLSSDGQRYAEVRDGKLWIGNFSKDRPEEEIPPPEPAMVASQALRFTPNGTALLVHFPDDSHRIWKISDGSWASNRFQNVAGLSFSPHSEWIAFGESGTKSVVIQDWKHQQEVVRFTSEFSDPAPLSFSPDGKLLAVAKRGGGMIAIYDAFTGKLSHRLENPAPDVHAFPRLAWRPDGHAVCVVTSSTDLFLWYLEAGVPPFQRRIIGHQAETQGVAWHPDGAWLVSIAFDGNLRLWEASSGRCGMVVPAIGNDLHFSADGQFLILHDTARHQLVRYRFSVPSVLKQVSLPRNSPDDSWQRGPWGVGISGDGRFAVIGSGLGTWVLDTSNGRRLAWLNTGLVNDVHFTAAGDAFWLAVPNRGVSKYAFSSGGTDFWALRPSIPLVSASGNVARLSHSAVTGTLAMTAQGNLRLIENPEGQSKVTDYPIPNVSMNPVAISPDGLWVVTASFDNKEEFAHVLDVTKRTIALRLPDTKTCYMIFSPDSQTLYTASASGLAAWSVATWTPRWSRANPSPEQIHRHVALSGDGRTLAFSRVAHGVDLVDPLTGQPLATIDDPDARAICWLALDHTGSHLAVNGSQQQIQLWNLSRLREELHTLHLDWPAPALPPSTNTPVEALVVLPP